MAFRIIRNNPRQWINLILNEYNFSKSFAETMHDWNYVIKQFQTCSRFNRSYGTYENVDSQILLWVHPLFLYDFLFGCKRGIILLLTFPLILCFILFDQSKPSSAVYFLHNFLDFINHLTLISCHFLYSSCFFRNTTRPPHIFLFVNCS